MYKILLVSIFAWVAAADKASAMEPQNEVAQNKPESRIFPPGFWFPLNIPTPAAGGAVPSTATVCTGCCLMQCVGGMCTAPSTCSNAPVMATACFANVVSATCTNLATCKTMPTAPCVAATADCVTTATCSAAPTG